MKLVLALLVGLVADVGCGDDEAPIDAAADVPIDGPSRCARTRDMYAVCGVCIEPHATLLGTSRVDARLYAVEGGVLFAFPNQLTAILINDAGEIVDSLTVDDPVLGADWSWLDPVPESRRVWGIVNRRGPNPDRSEDMSDLVLVDVSDTGLTELGSVRLSGYTVASTALDTGEILVATRADLTDEGVLMACGLRTGDAVTCREITGTEHVPTHFWDLGEGRAVVVTSVSGPLAGGDAWLYVVDSTRGIESGPTPIQAPPTVEFEEDGYARVATAPSGAYAVHRDHTAAVLLRGTYAGMGASPLGHYFLRRINENGEFLDAAPGIWVNPDAFAMFSNAPDVVVSGSIGTAARNQTYISWPISSPSSFEYVQLVDAGGEPRFPSSVTNASGLRDIGGPGYIDGADRMYSNASVLTGTNPERPSESSFAIDLINDDLSYAWDEPLYYQACARIDERAIAAIGASDDGVWVVWQDVVVGELDGLPYTQIKIARIMPDGDFGWRFEE